MDIIEKLKDDNHYYGKFGKQFLSNSDIGTLLKNPKMFKKESIPSLPMLQGRYFHTMMLEPEKIKDFKVCEATTRTTKLYKETISELDEDIIILQKEVNEIQKLCEEVKKNVFFNELIYDENNIFEQPAISEIGNMMWKGKADIITSDVIVDLKTTARIDDFPKSARRYKYDSQAWIYSQLFKKPMLFLVIEKNSARTGLYDCSDEFLDAGREKVHRALEIYNTFFGESPTEDIDQFFINQTL